MLLFSFIFCHSACNELSINSAHIVIYIYIYICYEECLQYISIISLDSIKRVVFKMDTDCVLCALGTEVLCMKI